MNKLKQETPMSDYNGKEVYVGIDVHKQSFSIYCVCEKEKIKSWSMASDNEELIKQLQTKFAGAKIKSVYEAGFCGYVLHRKLIISGIENIVINPSSIEVASKDRVKTDKKDAKKLAEQLSFGRLACINIPSESEEQTRLMSRLRATQMKERNRVTCRIKSLLMQFGYMSQELSSAASKKWIKQILAGNYPQELGYVLSYHCEQWLSLSEALKETEKALENQTRGNEKLTYLEQIYKSAPGIGSLSAQELSRELGDLSQFRNNKCLYSFTGLTPSEFSSGERIRQGGISQCGRPRIRHLLIEIAWRGVYQDKLLLEKFESLSHRRGKKRAIVAIARILIGQIRICIQRGVMYEQVPVAKK